MESPLPTDVPDVDRCSNLRPVSNASRIVGKLFMGGDRRYSRCERVMISPCHSIAFTPEMSVLPAMDRTFCSRPDKRASTTWEAISEGSLSVIMDSALLAASLTYIGVSI
jgi:hypothetical protein